MKSAIVMVRLLLAFGTTGCRRASVHQSTTQRHATDAPPVSLSGHWSEGASNIHYATSGVGLGGRLLAYRLSAPLDALDAFAAKEFETQGIGFVVTTTRVDAAEVNVQALETAYSVRMPWFSLGEITRGVCYRGEGLRHISVWIDADRDTMFFLMTD